MKPLCIAFLLVFALAASASASAGSPYTASLAMRLGESVRVDCPPGDQATYHHPYTADGTLDRAALVVFCGVNMTGPVLVDGAPYWHMQPASPLAAPAAPAWPAINLPFVRSR